MTRYLYSVWFQDRSADSSDQDYEWVACIYIEAETAEDARSWGDHLSKSYCDRRPHNVFLWSDEITTMSDVTDWSGPVVVYGQEASDEYIGW
jgi:hypothetical protein